MTIQIPADALDRFLRRDFRSRRLPRRRKRAASRLLLSTPISPATTATASFACRVTSTGSAQATSFPTSRSNVWSIRRSSRVLDGRFGFGQTMAPMAVDIGVEKAKATGLSAISLRNSGHVGRVGEWAERAAAAGLISIHFVNAAGSILVAPFGGLDRRLSTAPFCAGIPREGAAPVDARLRDIAGRRRQGQRREPWRQAAAGGRVDRSRRSALRRSRAALWPAESRTARATTAAAPARSAPSASIRAPASR